MKGSSNEYILPLTFPNRLMKATTTVSANILAPLFTLLHRRTILLHKQQQYDS
jgi:hypothetical protein